MGRSGQASRWWRRGLLAGVGGFFVGIVLGTIVVLIIASQPSVRPSPDGIGPLSFILMLGGVFAAAASALSLFSGSREDSQPVVVAPLEVPPFRTEPPATRVVAPSRFVAPQPGEVGREGIDDSARLRYAYELRLVQADQEQGHFRKARERLDGLDESLRGWEWDYLMGSMDHSLFSLVGGERETRLARFSPDGCLVVTAGIGVIRVWDVQTGEKVRAWSMPGWLAQTLRWSPDGKCVVTVESSPESQHDFYHGDTVRLWNAETGKELRAIRIRSGTAIFSLSAALTHVAAARIDPEVVVVWDLRTGNEVRRFKIFADAVSLNRDGTLVATVSVGGGITVYDVATGDEVVSINTGELGYVNVNFSADGRRLATVSSSAVKLAERVDVFNSRTGEKLCSLEESQRLEPGSPVFTPDGSKLCDGSKVWDANTGKVLHRYSGRGGVAVSPDGSCMASTTEVIGLADGKVIRTLEGHRCPVTDVDMSADGTRVVTAAEFECAKLWDANQEPESIRLLGHSRAVVSAVFSPDDRMIATASWDSTAKLWCARTQRELKTLQGHTEAVTGVAFHPSGERLLTVSLDGTFRQWDSRTGEEVCRVDAGSGALFGISVSANAPMAVTVSSEAVKLWELGEDRVEAVAGVPGEEWPDGNYVGGAISDDGKRMLVATADEAVYAFVWDIENRVLVRRFWFGEEELFSAEGPVLVTPALLPLLDRQTGRPARAMGTYGVGWSAEGERVVCPSRNCVAVMGDAMVNGRQLEFKGHTKELSGAILSPDERRVITTSWDGTARVWDSEAGLELLCLNGHDGPVLSAAFSHDGARLVTSSEDCTAVIWSNMA